MDKMSQDATVVKIAYLKCPKHDIPFTMESSRDPVHEGHWKHYYCRKCRQERMEDKDPFLEGKRMGKVWSKAK